MPPSSSSDPPAASAEERIPLRLSPSRAALAACLVVAALGVPGLLMGWWVLGLSLPALGLLALAVTWIHWKAAPGTVVIAAEAIEVRRWGRLVERYHFADVAALGLGQSEAEQQYVG